MSGQCCVDGIERGMGNGKRYLNMDVENDDSASEQNRIYRKKVA